MLLNNIENILDLFSDGVIAIDKDLRIISFSKGAERITGFLAVDVNSKNFNEVFKSELDVHKLPIADVLENGKSLANIKTKINNVDNKPTTISINATPLKDVKGEIIGLIVNFRDIEEVYKLHAELFTENARLISILNSITDGVLTVDNEWRITSFNPAAEKITGHKAENVMGKQCYEVMKSETCKTNCPLRKTMATKIPVYDYEIEIVGARGEIIPISVNTALLIDEQDNIIGGVETFRDLSMYKHLSEELNLRYSFANIIGKDKRMQEMYSLLEVVSPTSTTILIMGETGTGKELVARAIHHNSSRKNNAFMKVDCTALPETLLESELFGYKKGAFTDAKTDKPGKFQLADKGTIFLDEIGELPPSIQAKLLRVLEEHELEPLGGIKTVKIDVRIIAATNRDLQQAIKQGKFREDFYYRLNVVPITIPPLRDRPEDIPLLIEHFIKIFGKRFNKTITNVSPDAMDLLLDYPWPGNVRQLEHAIEHAFIHCTGKTIQARHLPDEIKKKSSPLIERILNAEVPTRAIEKEVIINALRRNNWDREKTAKVLKISRITLWRKMKKYAIQNK
ncbi:MAG: sigma 54-interacting transcriptional regulator [bacterium]